MRSGEVSSQDLRMELQPVTASIQKTGEDDKIYVFLIFDVFDRQLSDEIQLKLDEHDIAYSSNSERPGMIMFNTCTSITQQIKKTIFILSPTSSRNMALKYLVSMTFCTIPKENLITVYIPSEESVQDDLQVNLSEYLKYQKSHKDYNTAKVFREFRNLCDINSSVTVILRGNEQDNPNLLTLAKQDIADFTAATIDTSIAQARCDWSVACTIKGKYSEDEQRFLKTAYPYISYTLMSKFIESLVDPILPDYENFDTRVESYPKSWREEDIEQVKEMSAAGFLYAGFGETGRCFHCGCALTNIRSHSGTLIQHAARYPTCKFVKRNLTEMEIQGAVSKIKGSEEEKHKTAESVRERFNNIETRIETFTKSNIYFDNMAESLARAGFYYIGLENIIQCFSCSTRIYGIEEDQNPWSIHAALSPKCPYLIEEKGEHFINEIHTAQETTINEGYTVITFLRKTCDGTKRRKWPKNMFRPW